MGGRAVAVHPSNILRGSFVLERSYVYGSDVLLCLWQLLVEMDGMATKEGVVILASTNRSDILDKVRAILPSVLSG